MPVHPVLGLQVAAVVHPGPAGRAAPGLVPDSVGLAQRPVVLVTVAVSPPPLPVSDWHLDHAVQYFPPVNDPLPCVPVLVWWSVLPDKPFEHPWNMNQTEWPGHQMMIVLLLQV